MGTRRACLGFAELLLLDIYLIILFDRILRTIQNVSKTLHRIEEIHTMRRTVIRYRAKPEATAENERLIKSVFAEPDYRAKANGSTRSSPAF